MRLINAEELKKLRHEVIQGRIKFDGNEYDLIDKCPTVDAVTVVRCRECKYKNKKKCPMIMIQFGRNGKELLVQNHVSDDFFCAEGERKEGAD